MGRPWPAMHVQCSMSRHMFLQVKTWQGIYDPNVEYEKSLMKKEIKPLIWYPTVYFLISFLPLVNR